MKTYTLKIVTPKESRTEENVVKTIVKTTSGDIGIMADHVPYVSMLKKGEFRVIYSDNTEKRMTCDGGFIKVGKEQTVILSQSVS